MNLMYFKEAESKIDIVFFSELALIFKIIDTILRPMTAYLQIGLRTRFSSLKLFLCNMCV